MASTDQNRPSRTRRAAPNKIADVTFRTQFGHQKSTLEERKSFLSHRFGSTLAGTSLATPAGGVLPLFSNDDADVGIAEWIVAVRKVVRELQEIVAQVRENTSSGTPQEKALIQLSVALIKVLEWLDQIEEAAFITGGLQLSPPTHEEIKKTRHLTEALAGEITRAKRTQALVDLFNNLAGALEDSLTP